MISFHALYFKGLHDYLCPGYFAHSFLYGKSENLWKWKDPDISDVLICCDVKLETSFFWVGVCLCDVISTALWEKSAFKCMLGGFKHRLKVLPTFIIN